MADKGFTIQDLLPLGVSLNISPFLGSSSQLPAADVVHTQELVHTHRMCNQQDKQFPLVWSVCAILCNAQPNIISI